MDINEAAELIRLDKANRSEMCGLEAKLALEDICKKHKCDLIIHNELQGNTLVSGLLFEAK